LSELLFQFGNRPFRSGGRVWRGILAHEMGHAGIRLNNPWYSSSRVNQSVLRPVGGWSTQ
jgi:hypothetical protein